MEYNNLHLETVTDQLSEILQFLMKEPIFDQFRLVGGTNLSLRYGHRYSVDIDLFTDALYGSVDFQEIDNFLMWVFPYCDFFHGAIGFGKMYYIGKSKEESIKLDLMYTDQFLDPAEEYGVVRMASERDIAAMKMEAVFTGGRKKDFWDIDYMADNIYSLDQMCNFHALRQPYTHDRQKLLEMLRTFTQVNDQEDPVCLLNKNWNDIRMNMVDRVNAGINTYTKLLSKYGADAMEQDVEILLSQHIYSDKKYLGDMCQYKYKGEPQTVIL